MLKRHRAFDDERLSSVIPAQAAAKGLALAVVLALTACGGDPCRGIELEVDYCVNDRDRPVQSAGCGIAEFEIKNVAQAARRVTLAVIRPDAVPEEYELPPIRIERNSLHREAVTPTAPGHRIVVKACE